MSHGGDIYRNNIKIDLSVSINPLGCPGKVNEAMLRAVSAVQAYPDIRHEKLIDGLSELTGIRKDRILVGNGASELIMTVMRYFAGRRVLLPVPSFSGYSYAAKAADCVMIEYSLSPENGFDMAGFPEFIRRNAEVGDVVVFANPNNPNGRLAESRLLNDIILAAQERNTYVVIDECFLMLTGREEEVSAKRCSYDRLIVIDAFTKTFAIPGVRLGMACFKDAELAAKIRKLLPEWNISCVAEAAGLEAVKILREYYDDEKNYIKASIEFINKERDRIVSQLADLSDRIKVFPSDANYILIKTDIDLYEQMLSCGILIRDCKDYHGLGQGYYRISISTEKNNLAFLDELRRLMEYWR